jgi:hypothetical protein
MVGVFPLGFAGGCSTAGGGAGRSVVGGRGVDCGLGLSGPIVESGDPGSINGNGDGF